MWRAYIPVRDKNDLDGFPSWLVSFDGVNFIEVRHKPDNDRKSTMHALWSVVVNGHRKRRGQTKATTMPTPEPVTRKEIELVGGTIEVVTDGNNTTEHTHRLVGPEIQEEEYEV